VQLAVAADIFMNNPGKDDVAATLCECPFNDRSCVNSTGARNRDTVQTRPDLKTRPGSFVARFYIFEKLSRFLQSILLKLNKLDNGRANRTNSRHNSAVATCFCQIHDDFSPACRAKTGSAPLTEGNE
jgi:hypothetical protein